MFERAPGPHHRRNPYSSLATVEEYPGLTERPVSEAQSIQAITRTPPPYRLTCDLAIIPIIVETQAVKRWYGLEILSLFSRTVLFLLLARYHHAEYGPQSAPMPPPEGYPDLYREIALAALVRGERGFSMVFPQLWLDTPDPTPIELGWYYGFPKYWARIDWQRNGDRLKVDVQDRETPLASIHAKTIGWVPQWSLRAFASSTVLFPLTGRQAYVVIEGATSRSLLIPTQIRLPLLKSMGTRAVCLPGLWLKRAVILLSAPR